MGILLLIFWVCCGFGCAQIAADKNRDSAVWFILGVLFGVLALATISVLPPL